MNFLERVLIKLHLKKPIDYNSIEYLRSRGIEIGENVHLYNTNIDFGHGFLVSIGNNVTLTGVMVLAHDASTQISLGVSKVGRVRIGNNVFVGHRSIVLPGVSIGDNCVIGAGSVVSKNIPSGSIAVGNPIRIVGCYENFVKKHKAQMEQRPVFSTFWVDKSDEEKADMKAKLADGIGYDK